MTADPLRALVEAKIGDMRKRADGAHPLDYRVLTETASDLEAMLGAAVVPNVAMARHWIDRYASGVDDEVQMDRIFEALGIAEQQPAAALSQAAVVGEPFGWVMTGPCGSMFVPASHKHIVDATVQDETSTAIEVYTAPKHGAQVPEGWRITRMDNGEILVIGPNGGLYVDNSGTLVRRTLFELAGAMLAAAPAAAPAVQGVVESSPEFTDTARAALAWVLYHHQGGSSPVGGPIRFALGMGADEQLQGHQIAEAKRWAELTKSQTADFHKAAAPAVVVDKARDLFAELDRLCNDYANEKFKAIIGPLGGHIGGLMADVITARNKMRTARNAYAAALGQEVGR